MALVSRVHSLDGLFNRLCKVPKCNNVQIAHICRKINLIDRPRPPPYPYKEKKIGYISGFLDFAIARYDENSRLVVVEGPVAAGKDKFARELAKELKMGYMPPPSFDVLYKDYFGNDLRSLDNLLPPRMQTCDTEKFLTNPKHENVPVFLLSNYLLKLHAYAESLCHILSTGEGVVLNRCVYSDFVFMEAMFNAGYIERKYRRYYEEAKSRSLQTFLRPHLVIYLDVPVDIVKENIKKRGIPYEVNSEVLTTKYLTDIERIYKDQFLPTIEKHACVLTYDWGCDGDIEDVLHDIENVDFELSLVDRSKYADWDINNANAFTTMRKVFSRENRDRLLHSAIIPDFECSAFYLIGEDNEKYTELLAKYAPQYEPGYDPDKDKVLWKYKEEPFRKRFVDVITHQELLTCS